MLNQSLHTQSPPTTPPKMVLKISRVIGLIVGLILYKWVSGQQYYEGPVRSCSICVLLMFYHVASSLSAQPVQAMLQKRHSVSWEMTFENYTHLVKCVKFADSEQNSDIRWLQPSFIPPTLPSSPVNYSSCSRTWIPGPPSSLLV